MTKTPGEFEPPKPITKAERQARKAFRQVDARKALAEHEQTQRAFNENRERLRAERIARETVKRPMFYPAPELFDDTPIDNVRFTTRIRTAVTAAGWKTVGEIREAFRGNAAKSSRSRKRLCRPSSRNVGFAIRGGGAPARAEGEGEMSARWLFTTTGETVLPSRRLHLLERWCLQWHDIKTGKAEFYVVDDWVYSVEGKPAYYFG
jgi:hypothetical protein